MRASLREEITFEIEAFLIESQKETLKLLKPKTGDNVRKEDENDLENETRSYHTPTKLVRINSTNNKNPITSRHMVTGVFKRAKIKSQSRASV